MNVLIVRLENARSVNIYVYLQCVTAVIILGRVALVAQRLIVIKLSRERSVGRSVGLSLCPVHCRKTADRIRMPFGIIGRTGPGMRQFGDRSTGRDTFGGEFVVRHCNQWGLYSVRVRQRRDAATYYYYQCVVVPEKWHWDRLIVVLTDMQACTLRAWWSCVLCQSSWQWLYSTFIIGHPTCTICHRGSVLYIVYTFWKY